MKEKKVSMYDPSKDAFRELDIETAKKFIESAKKVEAQLAKLEDE